MEDKQFLFTPRPYQQKIIDAFQKYKKLVIILPRRAGKDLTAFHMLVLKALQKTGIYYYIFPTYAQGKKALWQSITNEGIRFIDYIPSELILDKNNTEMTLILCNNSIIQILGSTDFNKLRGTNPQGAIFSEHAYQDERAYTHFIRPVLSENGGFACFLSTPFGKNHFYTLFQRAKEFTDEWFSLYLTVEDTKHIELSEIQKLIDSGEMSQELVNQEFYCSFDRGVEGSYYSNYINDMRLQGRIGKVLWDTSLPVYTAWDIGVRDQTCIAFFQLPPDGSIRLIDAYEGNQVGIDHYIRLVLTKPYQYKEHIAPHDMRVREFGSGNTRLLIASQLGINFTVAPKLSVADGIESVRALLPKFFIDEDRCEQTIKALENYHHEFDFKNKIYRDTPLHDWSSHWADCIKYLCIAVRTSLDSSDDLTVEKLEKIRQQVYNNNNSNLPLFRN